MPNSVVHVLFAGFVGLGCMAMQPVAPKDSPRTVDATQTSLEVVGAGASLEQLTRDPQPETGPVLAPDGGQLLFTKVGTVMGTQVFMSPEQRHDSSSVDLRADIYSVAASLFTFLRAAMTG